MAAINITRLPDDETVFVSPRTESVEYEITDAGKTVETIDTSVQPEVLSREQIAQNVLMRKAHELHTIRRLLRKGKRDTIRAAEREKAKSKNRKKNKVARASRKKNKR